MDHVYENVRQVKKRATRLFGVSATPKSSEEYCKCPPKPEDVERCRKFCAPARAAARAASQRGAVTHMPSTELKVHESRTENQIPLNSNFVLPEGRLLRCTGCSFVHLCYHRGRRARAHARAMDSDEEELRADTDGPTAGQTQRTVTPPVDADDDSDDPQPSGVRMQPPEPLPELPQGPEHAECRRALGRLKGTITLQKKGKDKAAATIKALNGELKVVNNQNRSLSKELDKVKRDLHAWTLNASALEAGDEELETLKRQKLELQGEVGQLQKLLSAEKKKSSTPSCSLPEHTAPFCSDPEHAALSDQLRQQTCNIARHAELEQEVDDLRSELGAANVKLQTADEAQQGAVDFAAAELAAAIDGKSKAENERDEEKKKRQQDAALLQKANDALAAANDAAKAWESKYIDLRGAVASDGVKQLLAQEADKRKKAEKDLAGAHSQIKELEHNLTQANAKLQRSRSATDERLQLEVQTLKAACNDETNKRKKAEDALRAAKEADTSGELEQQVQQLQQALDEARAARAPDRAQQPSEEEKRLRAAWAEETTGRSKAEAALAAAKEESENLARQAVQLQTEAQDAQRAHAAAAKRNKELEQDLIDVRATCTRLREERNKLRAIAAGQKASDFHEYQLTVKHREIVDQYEGKDRLKAFLDKVGNFRKKLDQLVALESDQVYYQILGTIRRLERELDKETAEKIESLDPEEEGELIEVLEQLARETDGQLQRARARLMELDGGTEGEGRAKEEEQPPHQAGQTAGQRADDNGARAPPGRTADTAPAPGDGQQSFGSHRAGDGGRAEESTQSVGAPSASPATSSVSTASTLSRSTCPGEDSFYLALPPPWNYIPDGNPVDLANFTRIISAPSTKKFNGTVASYPAFRAGFLVNFHSAKMPVMLKCQALQELCGSALTGFAEDLHPSQAAYGCLIRRIEEEFGGDDRQLVGYLDGIEKCKVVKEGDLKGMQFLVDTVTKYHAALPAHRSHEAHSMQHAVELIRKLGDDLVFKYRQYCKSLGVASEYDVNLMLNWLKEHNIRLLQKRDDKNKNKRAAALPQKKTSSTPQAASSAKATFLVNGEEVEVEGVLAVDDGGAGAAGDGAATKTGGGKTPPCLSCSGLHKLDVCQKFKSKPPGTRRALVVGAELCPKCLVRGHFQTECSAPGCTTCDGDHHALIHGWNDRSARGGGGQSSRGGRGRGRGRGGAGGGQQQQQQPTQKDSGSRNNGNNAGNKSALEAKAAADPGPPSAAENKLYSADGTVDQAQTFFINANFIDKPAQMSREARGAATSHGRGLRRPGADPALLRRGRERGVHQVRISIEHGASYEPEGQAEDVFNTSEAAAATVGAPEMGAHPDMPPRRRPPQRFTSLRYAVIRIRSEESAEPILVNALLDDGASLSLLSKRAAEAAGLKGEERKLQVSGYGGQMSTATALYCRAAVESRNGHFRVPGRLVVVDDPVGELHATPWQAFKQYWPHMQDINFASPLGGGKVDMILGSDLGFFHRSIREVHGPRACDPCARLTPAGWTASGLTVPGELSSDAPGATIVAASYDTFAVLEPYRPSLDIREADSFLKQEAGDSVSGGPLAKAERGVFLNADDRAAMKAILDSWRKCDDGRIEIRPLWKGESRPPNNVREATADWERTKRWLLAKGLMQSYAEVFDGWLQNGYIEEVPEQPAGRGEEKEPAGFFLPHFPVVRMDKQTTKVRVVSNGAAEFNGVSLNTCMKPGPKVINTLVQVLLRFRRHRWAVIGDISNMFLRVKIPPEDRKYHRFVFSEEGATEHKYYQAVGHVFGSSGSLTIAITVIKLAAIAHRVAFPLACDTVLKSSLVDDNLASVKTKSELAETITGLQRIAESVGMKLHKWCSNAAELLPKGGEVVNEAEIVDKAGPAGEQASQPQSSLGLVWVPAEDAFHFKFSKDCKPPWTKLKVLKLYMSLFDPLGLLLPFIMSARILYRDLWRDQAGWHDALTQEQEKGWRAWLDQLSELQNFSFPRNVSLEEEDFIAVFSDASDDGYGACCYLVSDTRSVLLYARGKVNANRARTTPVLELLGAELGVRAAGEIARAFGRSLLDVKFFVDSRVVLTWVRSPNRDATVYIGRKAAQIREATNPHNWHYVPTGENPADLLSRGTTLVELLGNRLWWIGPPFVTKPETEWPQHGVPAHGHPELPGERELEELIGVYVTAGKPVPARAQSPYHDCESWVNLQSGVSRAVRKWRKREPDTKDKELLDFIRLEQAVLWPQELSVIEKRGKLPAKHPWAGYNFSVHNGVLFVSGRTGSAALPVLGKQSRLAALWLEYVHARKLLHTGGHKTMLATSQKTVWIFGAVAIARRVLRTCVVCKQLEPTPFAPTEAPLPSFRVGRESEQGIFTHVLVDEFGPKLTKQGRGRPGVKRWVLVVVCGAVRAVHLELLVSKEAEQVAQALVRFACRRTVPKMITSDNAPEFAAAYQLLQAGAVPAPDGSSASSWGDLKWNFYPPMAPHFGGAVEAAVKLTKRALNKIIDDREMTDLQLCDALVLSEFLINSRPIGAQSSDPRDLQAITCNDMLGGAGASLAVGAGLTGQGVTQAWEERQARVAAAWRRTLDDLLPQLEKKNKWISEGNSPEVGDAVVALNVPPPAGHRVAVGVVARVRPGRDGIVREVDLNVGDRIYRRAVHSLAPLMTAKELAKQQALRGMRKSKKKME